MSIKTFEYRTWAIHTKERDDAGMPPFIRFTPVSARMLQSQWIKRYGIAPTRINPCHWDSETSTYVEEV